MLSKFFLYFFANLSIFLSSFDFGYIDALFIISCSSADIAGFVPKQFTPKRTFGLSM